MSNCNHQRYITVGAFGTYHRYCAGCYQSRREIWEDSDEYWLQQQWDGRREKLQGLDGKPIYTISWIDIANGPTYVVSLISFEDAFRIARTPEPYDKCIHQFYRIGWPYPDTYEECIYCGETRDV